MKKINLLTPILGIATLSGAVIPMVGCSCKNSTSKAVELSNNTIETAKTFGITGNFNAGTSYEFNADLSKWTNEFGKPTTEEWEAVQSVWFEIKYVGEGKTLAADDVDVSKAQITVDGKVLERVSEAEMVPIGKWQYGYSGIEIGIHQFSIRTFENNPIKIGSKISLSNIKFKSNVQNVCVTLNEIHGQ